MLSQWVIKRPCEKSPREAKWYDVEHEFNDFDSLIDRAYWLQKEIGINSVRAILLERLNAKDKK